MSNYISQTFSVKSLQLLDYNAKIKITKISKDEIPNDCISIIGHKENAYLINKLLGTSYKDTRKGITLSNNDNLYIVIYKNGLIDIKEIKNIPAKELENLVICLKVTVQGFQVESKTKRLIRQASSFLTHNFSFKFLGNIDYEAELDVTKIDKSQIPSTGIRTYIANDNQRKFLEKELDITISKKHKKWKINDGDTFYIVTIDEPRSPNGGVHLEEEYYKNHSIYLKIEVHGINAVEITDEN